MQRLALVMVLVCFLTSASSLILADYLQQMYLSSTARTLDTSRTLKDQHSLAQAILHQMLGTRDSRGIPDFSQVIQVLDVRRLLSSMLEERFSKGKPLKGNDTTLNIDEICLSDLVSMPFHECRAFLKQINSLQNEAQSNPLIITPLPTRTTPVILTGNAKSNFDTFVNSASQEFKDAFLKYLLNKFYENYQATTVSAELSSTNAQKVIVINLTDHNAIRIPHVERSKDIKDAGKQHSNRYYQRFPHGDSWAYPQYHNQPNIRESFPRRTKNCQNNRWSKWLNHQEDDQISRIKNLKNFRQHEEVRYKSRDSDVGFRDSYARPDPKQFRRIENPRLVPAPRRRLVLPTYSPPHFLPNYENVGLDEDNSGEGKETNPYALWIIILLCCFVLVFILAMIYYLKKRTQKPEMSDAVKEPLEYLFSEEDEDEEDEEFLKPAMSECHNFGSMLSLTNLVNNLGTTSCSELSKDSGPPPPPPLPPYRSWH